ncbi:helix-turn-helix domain-containing protein [Paraburkholderia xenovorans]|uniref:helix-turn-helix domain-containing protein n=1 Tax=Paraburkholderia xenovorans TaxID=36873 RepID=UPI0038B7F0F5
MELKDWIRAARKAAGLTQEQLGERLGLTKGNVSAWENARHEPSYAQLQQIADLSGMGLPNVEHNHTPGIDDASISAPKNGLIQDLPTRGKNRISGETSTEPDDANVSQALKGHREIPILTLEQASKMAATVDPHTLAEGLGTVTTYREVSAAAFAIPIKGPSMLPRFEDGDVVIIDPARPPKPGKFVLAGTHAGDAVFRKYRELGANDRGEMVFELAPLNDDFATLHSERDRLRIIGAMDAHINYDRDE